MQNPGLEIVILLNYGAAGAVPASVGTAVLVGAVVWLGGTEVVGTVVGTFVCVAVGMAVFVGAFGVSVGTTWVVGTSVAVSVKVAVAASVGV